MTKFNALDRQVIEILQKDGRIACSAIARELNVPERTVRSRLGRLLKENIIFPTAVVNHKAFGFSIAVDIFIEIEINKHEEVLSALMQIPELNYIAISTGDQDISIQALLKSSEDLYGFLKKLSTIPGISRTRTMIVPYIMKNTHEWIPPQSSFDGTI